MLYGEWLILFIPLIKSIWSVIESETAKSTDTFDIFEIGDILAVSKRFLYFIHEK